MESALQRLGITKLRPKQKKILKYIGNGQDVFGLLPTGYGKSACYIIPHLLTGKNVVVISPLIALMQDQYQALDACGISAICFNSHNPSLYGSTPYMGVRDKIRRGELKGVLYFSPEKFLQSEGLIRHLVATDNLALVAVDEAHCVVTWSDFRQGYQKLGCIREWIQPMPSSSPSSPSSPPPILALTASAPPSLLESLVKALHLHKPRLVQASFRKPHLSLEFREKKSFQRDLEAMAEEIRQTDAKTVIYCKTKKDTVKLSTELGKRLKFQGIPTSYYHGGLDAHTRQRTQTQFGGQARGVMVATIAFGMGIDIPDIHLLIHYGVSRDVESYYQEVGRAGRDGKAAECIAFYSRGDFALNRRFANDISEARHRQRQLDACVNLERLIRSPTCRMLSLMQYFGEKDGDVCKRCDRCLKSETSPDPDNALPSNYITYKTLSALDHLGYGCGLVTLVKILTGSKVKRMNPDMLRLDEFGCLRGTSSTQLRSQIEELHHQGYLREQSTGSGWVSFLKISPGGNIWLTEYRRRMKEIIQKLIASKFSAMWHGKALQKVTQPPPHCGQLTSSVQTGGKSTSQTDLNMKLPIYFTYRALLTLQVIPSVSTSTLLGILTGSMAKHITIQMRNIAEYGCMRRTTQKSLRPYVDNMMDCKLIQPCNSMGKANGIRITSEGKRWMDAHQTCIQAACKKLSVLKFQDRCLVYLEAKRINRGIAVDSVLDRILSPTSHYTTRVSMKIRELLPQLHESRRNAVMESLETTDYPTQAERLAFMDGVVLILEIYTTPFGK